MTLQEQIERSFGDGPPPPPLELTLAAGHRALRRRRIGAAVAAAAVVAVVGTGASVVATHGPTGGRGPDLPVASRGPLEGQVDEHPFRDGRLAAWAEDGSVQVRPGARVVERVDDPVGLRPDGDSVGLVLERAGERQWLLLTWDSSGMTAVRTTPERADVPFEAWLADLVADVRRQMARNDRHAGELEAAEHLVDFGTGETLVVADPTAELLDQAPTPVGRNLPPGPERSAVAMLRWHGETWFVLMIDHPGNEMSIYPTPARWADDAGTIEEYLAWRTGAAS